MSLEIYIDELKNKEEIESFEKKILDTELEIDKIGQKRLICIKYTKEMENELNKLRKKALEHPKNEKIEDELKETEEKLKKSEKRIHKLNEGITDKEIVLLRFQQTRREEIKMGLINYFHDTKLKCEKLRNKWIRYNEMAMVTHDELKKTEEELESVKRVIKSEFGEE
ncbi:MAG: hypothetical protein HZC47_00785 [Methanobacterium sp.]|uniref:hypothetical protein n=1 Tax=Methanobacterium sp. TaxID=2164 RepID=UPI003D645AA5|nr:hypothetical protein [Methanobacterium sp.]